MKNAILGCWELVSFEVRLDDGTVIQPYGPDARGTLVYAPEGWMTVQVSRAMRPSFESKDMWNGTPEEIRAAVQGYIAYFGRYELNEDERTVSHHVEGSLFPNWVGDVQQRTISLEGAHLALSAPPMRVGDRVGTSVLVWKRRSPVSQ